MRIIAMRVTPPGECIESRALVKASQGAAQSLHTIVQCAPRLLCVAVQVSCRAYRPQVPSQQQVNCCHGRGSTGREADSMAMLCISVCLQVCTVYAGRRPLVSLLPELLHLSAANHQTKHPPGVVARALRERRKGTVP
jgi:hypothetical protein